MKKFKSKLDLAVKFKMEVVFFESCLTEIMMAENINKVPGEYVTELTQEELEDFVRLAITERITKLSAKTFGLFLEDFDEWERVNSVKLGMFKEKKWQKMK